MKEIAYTGQVIEEIKFGSQWVKCPVCESNNLISLNGNAWFDNTINKYVHYGCLSQERLNEISLKKTSV